MALQKHAHTVKLVKAYAPDWLLCVTLIIGFFLFDMTTPFKRRFSIEDKTISFPYAVEETVPPIYLALIAVGVPVLSIFLLALVVRKSAYDFHNGCLGLCLSLGLTIVTTSILKNTLGRLRPDFLDRCQIQSGTSTTDPAYSLFTMDICTQTDRHIFEDGMKAFPSGHSSISFAGLTFLSFFLAGKIRVFDQRGHTWKSFAVIIPLLCAALVAISRIRDYRHHWQDVLVGGLIGMLFASFSYHQYYPSLWSQQPWKPFSPRIPRSPSEVVDEISRSIRMGEADDSDPRMTDGERLV